VEAAIGEVKSELARLDLSGLEPALLVETRHSLETRLEAVAQRNLEALQSIGDDLRSLHWSRDEDGHFIGMGAMNESIQEELLSSRERAEADLELTQLGMAINVVNHEFESSIKTVRNNLRRLKSWVDINQELLPLYNGLRHAFDHIDGYLSLFTPLQRRLYRTEIEFSGGDIAKFLHDLFDPRLTRHSIDLKATDAFLRFTIMSYPSSFYPVFVNLIDNAIFWVKDRPLPRHIQLDSRDGAILISDSGPGIPDRDRDPVFELGFTRKPSGRGLGLYISRESLRKVGYNLSLAPRIESGGAVFLITPIRGDEEAGQSE